MDLQHHTERSLDTAVVRAAWVECAATVMGARAVSEAEPLGSAEVVRFMGRCVTEWTGLAEAGTAPSLSGAGDVAAAVVGSQKGEILEGSVLSQIGSTLWVLERVAGQLLDDDDVPELAGLASGIGVDPGVLGDLTDAFEPDGRLSERTYPQLGELRRSINSLHTSLRGTLDRMAKGDTLGDVLQDTFWTVRNDRYVLPLKPHARGMGVVHGTSGSGKTVFVEPHEIVELNNRLRLAEAALQQEERRILASLSRAVGAVAPEILRSLDALTSLDGVASRAELGRRLSGHPVEVRELGALELKNLRHPILVLRELEVIGHDLRLSDSRPALVLTGPNTGGKTVALKAVGLCAWMVRHGLPVPAEAGSRLDYFHEVIADVGDAQTVQDDLSSFSAQLVAVRSMLERAGPGVLVLLDELASGTDPSQGAALAQAVLERLVDAGARVVTTTHYPPLKGLAAADPRFAVAAMEVRDGRPTYRLIPDTTGESHALETAARLGLPPEVLQRADSLMLDGDRDLSMTLSALEQQRADLSSREAALAEARAETARLQEELERRTEQVRAGAKAIEEAKAAAFVDRLQKADRAIGAVIAQLQSSPSHRAVTAARQSLAAYRGLVPEQSAPPLAEAPVLAVGDRVRHAALGAGVVLAVGPKIRVQGRAVAFSSRPEDLDRIGGAAPKSVPVSLPAPIRERVVELADAMRVESNTLNLRGMRVDEALDFVDQGLDRAVSDGVGVVFVLHGHGTGALKTAVREALRTHTRAQRWAPANTDQGGDAFTVVAVR